MYSNARTWLTVVLFALSTSRLFSWFLATITGAMACVLAYLLTTIVATGLDLIRDHVQARMLERQSRIVDASNAKRMVILDEVIAGQLSLAEAAAELERLQARHQPRCVGYPEADASDFFARKIIGLAARRLQEFPEEQAAVLHRLENEYRAWQYQYQYQSD